LPGKGCGFVQFTSRQAAEMAAEKTFNKLVMKGRRLTIRWGRPQAQQNVTGQMGEGGRKLDPVPGLPQTLPPPPLDFFNLGGARRNEETNEEEEGTSKRQRTEGPPHGITQFVPKLPPGLLPPGMMFPKVPFVSPLLPGMQPPEEPGPSRGPPGIHYPSQDPSHLGSKDLRD